MSLSERIMADLAGEIASGAWPPGHRIPYEHELMARYGCARATVGKALQTKKADNPQVYQALSMLSGDIANQVKTFGSIKHVPAAATPNLRNDMYLTSAATTLLTKGKSALTKADAATLKPLASWKK